MAMNDDTQKPAGPRWWTAPSGADTAPGTGDSRIAETRARMRRDRGGWVTQGWTPKPAKRLHFSPEP